MFENGHVLRERKVDSGDCRSGRLWVNERNFPYESVFRAAEELERNTTSPSDYAQSRDRLVNAYLDDPFRCGLLASDHPLRPNNASLGVY